jgi:hypothetical protein
VKRQRPGVENEHLIVGLPSQVLLDLIERGGRRAALAVAEHPLHLDEHVLAALAFTQTQALLPRQIAHPSFSGLLIPASLILRLLSVQSWLPPGADRNTIAVKLGAFLAKFLEPAEQRRHERAGHQRDREEQKRDHPGHVDRVRRHA